MRVNSILMMAGLTVVLAGCSTMSENECLVSDWRSIGYEDGVRGYSGDRIGVYRKACVKHGVSPDLQVYQEGRAAGLREFCRPENGFDFGARGGNYRGVCPRDLEAEFTEAYLSGHQLYGLQTSVRQIERRLSAKQQRIEDIDEELIQASADLVADGRTVEERVSLLATTKRLAEEQRRLETEISELIEQKALRQDELARYEDQLAMNY